MSTEENKTLVRNAIEEAWNDGSLDAVEKYYAPEFTFYQEGGGVVHGVESFKEWVTTIHTAFPDVKYVINAMYAEDDKVATRYSITGTHTGDFKGLPPTNKPVDLTGHIIHRIKDGKKVEAWGFWDTLGLMQQLGLAPRMGPPAKE